MSGGQVAPRPGNFHSPSKVDTHGGSRLGLSLSSDRERHADYEFRLLQGNAESWQQAGGGYSSNSQGMVEYEHQHGTRPNPFYSTTEHAAPTHYRAPMQDHWTPSVPLTSSKWLPAPPPAPSVTFSVRPTPARVRDDNHPEDVLDAPETQQAKRSKKRK